MVTILPDCPDSERLRRLLLGLVAPEEAPPLEAHLLACDRCAERVRTLPLDDPLVAVTQTVLSLSGPDDRSIEELIGQLQSLPPPRPRQVHADGPSVAEARRAGATGVQMKELLAPAQEPGEIGRLGPYRILSERGRGGMGVVYEAEDTLLRRPVALKVLHPRLAGSQVARQRLFREAQTAAALQHDHIVTIHQVGEERGVPFLAMPLLRGENLQDRLAREGRLPLVEVVRIGHEVALGLATAHAQGLIHRDIKPANIWLEEGSGRVKILDFGVARPAESAAGLAEGTALTLADDASLTQEGFLVGTPAYMAPEQARGEAVDHRADLFSLGSVLYALCTGQPPFGSQRPTTVLQRLRTDSARPLGPIGPEIPEWLTTLVSKLHAPNPAQRFQSAAEVAELLGQHLVRLQQPRPPRRMPGWVIALGLIGLAGLGLTEATGVSRLLAPRLRSLPSRSEPSNPDPIAQAPVGEVFRLSGHTSEIQSLAFSPDGQRILVGYGLPVKNWQYEASGSDYRVRLYDRTTGQEVSSFHGHTAPVLAVAFAPDGKHALSADGVVRVWELATGKEVRSFETDGQEVRRTVFSWDGRHVLTADRSTQVHLWDVEAGTRLRTFTGLTDQIHGLALSPDGRWVLACGGGTHIDGKYVASSGETLLLWDAASGKELHRFGGATEDFQTLTVSPDGRFALTGGANRKPRLWNIASGEQLHAFHGHSDTVAAVAYSPDGRRLLSTAIDEPNVGDGTVRLWDARTGEELHRFGPHPGGVRSVIFSPDGQLALSGGIFDGTVRLWRLPPLIP